MLTISATFVELLSRYRRSRAISGDIPGHPVLEPLLDYDPERRRRETGDEGQEPEDTQRHRLRVGDQYRVISDDGRGVVRVDEKRVGGTGEAGKPTRRLCHSFQRWKRSAYDRHRTHLYPSLVNPHPHRASRPSPSELIHPVQQLDLSSLMARKRRVQNRGPVVVLSKVILCPGMMTMGVDVQCLEATGGSVSEVRSNSMRSASETQRSKIITRSTLPGTM